MAVTKLSLAATLQQACEKRRSVENCSEPSLEGAVASFFVYDNDGGILKVIVSQYKEPLR